MVTFQEFLEGLVEVYGLDTLTDSNLMLLISIYNKNDLPVPTDLTAETAKRSLIIH